MYSVYVLFSAALAMASAASKEECMRLGHPPHEMHCCLSNKSYREKFMDMKECFKDARPPMPPSPPPCDVDECIAKKQGYVDGEGNMDIKALETYLEGEMKDNPDTMEMIKNKCLNGDITLYAPPDACPLVQMRHCIQNQAIMTCTEFDDKKHCQDLKKKVDDCKA